MYYKLAKPDGFDFYTGETINYRDNIGKVVKPPDANPKGKLCSTAFIHASEKPNQCFVGAKIPCSAYRVEGRPVLCDDDKCGFTKLRIVEEITDLDNLFGWNYSEACNPIHPLKLPKAEITKDDLALLSQWDSVWASVRAAVGDSVWDPVGDAVWASVWDSVWASVWDSVWDSVGDSVWASVRASVGDSVWASVRDSVRAYIGSLVPNTEKWKYIECKKGIYPFQSVVDLWKRGIVAAFDGKQWYLLSGKAIEIIWKGKV